MNAPPRIKVCGLARTQDAALALQLGANALGVVQYPPSPRSVNAETAAQIFSQAPQQVLTVAVMVDLTPDEAHQWATSAGVRAIQLCGSENPADWTDFPIPILRRIPVDQTGSGEINSWKNIASEFVLDHPSTAGGSGQTVNPTLAAELCAQASCLLAGGLHGGNVADAICRIMPHGVDASSRLELEPGVKDPARLKDFVQSARQAFLSLTKS